MICSSEVLGLWIFCSNVFTQNPEAEPTRARVPSEFHMNFYPQRNSFMYFAVCKLKRWMIKWEKRCKKSWFWTHRFSKHAKMLQITAVVNSVFALLFKSGSFILTDWLFDGLQRLVQRRWCRFLSQQSFISWFEKVKKLRKEVKPKSLSEGIFS